MCKIFHVQKGKGNLLEQLRDQRKMEDASWEIGDFGYGLCGGRGACGKCRVHFLKAPPLPSFADRKIFSAKELRDGWRLACTSYPAEDAEAELHFAGKEKEPETKILTCAEIPEEVSLQKNNTVQENSTVLEESGLLSNIKNDRSVIAAVDIGTTTAVIQYVDKVTGDILGTYPFVNPQRCWGTDIITRILYGTEHGTKELQKVLITAITDGLKQLEKYGNPERIIVSGNTTMEHLLMGYPVASLGSYPFTPYSLELKEFDYFGHPMVLLPGISAFVGADIVSGIYACRMAERREMSMLIDLGTNGEIVIGNQDRLWCTAAAAGSSFEGDISVQAMGTDIITLAFEMLEQGVMDENGLMAEPWFTDGWEKGTVVIYQQDIRKLQMAKAAICAGISILLETAADEITTGMTNGITDETASEITNEITDEINNDAAGCQPMQVYLAGGFGYDLDVEKAVVIGLIPAELRSRCQAVGNTSLAGAIRYGRESGQSENRKNKNSKSKNSKGKGDNIRDIKGEGCAININEKGQQEQEDADQMLKRIVRISHPVNLAEHPEFQERYLKAMEFREMRRESFTNLT